MKLKVLKVWTNELTTLVIKLLQNLFLGERISDVLGDILTAKNRCHVLSAVGGLNLPVEIKEISVVVQAMLGRVDLHTGKAFSGRDVIKLLVWHRQLLPTCVLGRNRRVKAEPYFHQGNCPDQKPHGQRDVPTPSSSKGIETSEGKIEWLAQVVMLLAKGRALAWHIYFKKKAKIIIITFDSNFLILKNDAYRLSIFLLNFFHFSNQA